MNLWNYSDHWSLVIEFNPKWGDVPMNWLLAMDWHRALQLGIQREQVSCLGVKVNYPFVELELQLVTDEMLPARQLEKLAVAIAEGDRGLVTDTNMGRLASLEALAPIAERDWLLRPSELQGLRFGWRKHELPVDRRDRARLGREFMRDARQHPLKYLPGSRDMGFLPRSGRLV